MMTTDGLHGAHLQLKGTGIGTADEKGQAKGRHGGAQVGGRSHSVGFGFVTTRALKATERPQSFRTCDLALTCDGHSIMDGN